MNSSLIPARATPPGPILRRELDARGWTQKNLLKSWGDRRRQLPRSFVVRSRSPRRQRLVWGPRSGANFARHLGVDPSTVSNWRRTRSRSAHHRTGRFASWWLTGRRSTRSRS